MLFALVSLELYVDPLDLVAKGGNITLKICGMAFHSRSAFIASKNKYQKVASMEIF